MVPRNVRFDARAVLFLLVVASGACGPAIVMNPAGAEISAARLAAVPSRGIEWEFDFGGNHEAKEDWADAARASVDASIHYVVTTHGGRYFLDKSLGRLDGYLPFCRWAKLVLMDVMNAAVGRLRDPPASVDAFRYEGDLSSWRTALGADHVLITFFLDGHDSTGRALAVAFAGGWTARHEVASCVVRLADGRLIWCAHRNIVGDLRERVGAQKIVDGLMLSMLERAAATAPRPQPMAPPSPPAIRPPPPPLPSAKPATPVDQEDDEEDAPKSRP
jgi:hypothetical protein